MLNGHGDDLYQYPDIRINFSSNVYNHFCHDGLYHHLAQSLSKVSNYPAPTPHRLEGELSACYGLKAEEVIVTNGATEAIYLLAQTWRRSHSCILAPTFSEYADACHLHEHQVSYIDSLDALDDGVTVIDTDMVWLCNPNNPTGEVIDRETLLQVINSHPKILFVIDASYAVFTRKPLLSPAEAVQLPNVLMLHSMTKEFAIPGLRLGFITGAVALLAQIGRQRMPWSVNCLAQEAGHYLLSHHEDYALPLDDLLRECERIAAAFTQIGIHCWPSDTHILLCRLPIGKASILKESLARQYGLLIRDAFNFHSLDEHCFRIAVQTPSENDELIRAVSVCTMNYAL